MAFLAASSKKAKKLPKSKRNNALIESIALSGIMGPSVAPVATLFNAQQSIDKNVAKQNASIAEAATLAKTLELEVVTNELVQVQTDLRDAEAQMTFINAELQEATAEHEKLKNEITASQLELDGIESLLVTARDELKKAEAEIDSAVDILNTLTPENLAETKVILNGKFGGIKTIIQKSNLPVLPKLPSFVKPIGASILR